MTKKKNGFFSKLKAKFKKTESSDELDGYDDEFDEELEDDEYEEYEEDSEDEDHASDEDSEFEYVEVDEDEVLEDDDEYEYVEVDEDGTETVVAASEVNESTAPNIPVPTDPTVETALPSAEEIAAAEVEDEDEDEEELPTPTEIPRPSENIESELEEELEEVEEDEEYEEDIEVDEEDLESLIAQAKEDSEEEYEDEEEYDEDEEGYEYEEDEEEKLGIVARLKQRFEKLKPKSEDEDEDESAPQKVPVMQALLEKLKNKRSHSHDAPLMSAKKKAQSFNDLTIEQWLPYLLSGENKALIHKVFLTTFFVAIFFNIGKFAGLWLGQEPKKTISVRGGAQTMARYNPGNDMRTIKDNNIFNALESDEIKKIVKKPKTPEVKICLEAKRKSSLPLKLLNTIVLQDSVKSVASVSKRGKVFSFREGDKIDSDAEIGKISRLRMIFKNKRTGQCEYIENIDPKAKRLAKKNKMRVHSKKEGKKLLNKFSNKDIKVDGNNYKIKKGLRDKLLSNIGEVLTQARAIQIKNPDGTLSFRMTEVVPGSIYSQLNIGNGDIIDAINGKKFSNVNELLSLFGKVKEIDRINITKRSNGVEQTNNYEFTD